MLIRYNGRNSVGTEGKRTCRHALTALQEMAAKIVRVMAHSSLVLNPEVWIFNWVLGSSCEF
eukprot:1185012-Amorphochlora_amoeboformis.AAC.3